MPEVDFRRHVLVAAFLGQRMTGGYAVQISGVKETRRRLHLEFAEIRPGPGCLVSQELTHPYLLVAVPRSMKSLAPTFVPVPTVRDCQ